MNVTLYYSEKCFKSSSITGNHKLEKGKERECATSCLQLIEFYGWGLEDVLAVAMFDGEKEVCRRFIGGFVTIENKEPSKDYAVDYLTEMFKDMLTVDSQVLAGLGKYIDEER